MAASASLIPGVVQEPEPVELAERRDDRLLRRREIDVEGTRELVGDGTDRAAPIASVPDEARGRVEPVNLLGHAVEHDRVPLDIADTDVGSPLRIVTDHAVRMV